MDRLRRIGWTRRTVGLTLGGLAASVMALVGQEDAIARKKRKPRRCRTLLQSCQRGKKWRRCCDGLHCSVVNNPEGGDSNGRRVCCKGVREPCASEDECCGVRICDPIFKDDLAGNRCCGSDSAPCQTDSDCCTSKTCVAGACSLG